MWTMQAAEISTNASNTQNHGLRNARCHQGRRAMGVGATYDIVERLPAARDTFRCAKSSPGETREDTVAARVGIEPTRDRLEGCCSIR